MTTKLRKSISTLPAFLVALSGDTALVAVHPPMHVGANAEQGSA